MMKLVVRLLAAAALSSVAACDVDQTKEGEMPKVEVNASGGEMPEFDVDGPSVNVTTEKKTIEVPKVDVEGPKDDNKE